MSDPSDPFLPSSLREKSPPAGENISHTFSPWIIIVIMIIIIVVVVLSGPG